jgi:hypothetical protein
LESEDRAEDARWVITMQARTARAVAGTVGPNVSPISRTDHTSVSRGWASCSWLARATPIIPMPRYQTTKPPNCETAAM